MGLYGAVERGVMNTLRVLFFYHIRVIGVLVLFLIGHMCHMNSCYASAFEKQTLTRQDDFIVINGKDLCDMQGKAIAKIRVFAFNNNEFHPIPYQIDERDKDNNLILQQGEDAGQDDDNNLLDANDELVIMARDMGDRGDPTGAYNVPHKEIEITDPLSNKKAWAYVMFFDSEPPKPSDRDYVNIAFLKDGRENINAWYYKLSYPNNHVFFDQRIVTPAGGGTGVDLLDRLKIRGGVKLKWFLGGFTIERNENDFITRTVGYIDGPVRVVRRTANKIRVLANLIYSPEIIVDGVYYYSSFFMPSNLNVPVSPRKFLDNVYMLQTQEQNENSEGMIFYNSNNSNGVVLDGKMSYKEKNLDRSDFEWAVFAGKQGKFLYSSILDEKLPVKKCLYYIDDVKKMNPPEDEPGEYGNNGYDLKGLMEVQKGNYKIDMWGFVMPEYTPGMEKKYLDIIYHPIRIGIK